MFDFLKRLFCRKKVCDVKPKQPIRPKEAVSPVQKPLKIDIFSPCPGELIAQKDIPDEGFSEGYMGSGVGIIPKGGEFQAYMTGELAVLYKTKHAYFIKDTASNISVMLHIGINTVEIPEDKKAFITTRRVNEKLTAGDTLCVANLDVISAEGKSTTTALLVQADNMENKKIIYHKNPGDQVEAGAILMSVVPK